MCLINVEEEDYYLGKVVFSDSNIPRVKDVNRPPDVCIEHERDVPKVYL
jgi:hypothetical protein